MFCPMKFTSANPNFTTFDCEKEACAWWFRGACAIYRIAANLDVLAATSAATVRKI